MRTVVFDGSGYGSESIVLGGVKFQAHEPKEISDELAEVCLRRSYFKDVAPGPQVTAEPIAPPVPKRRGRKHKGVE